MRVKCTQCGTAYLVDEKKIPKTGGKITCTRCGHINIVQGTKSVQMPLVEDRLAEPERRRRSEPPTGRAPHRDDGSSNTSTALADDPYGQPTTQANVSSETNVWKLKSPSTLRFDFKSLHDLRRWAKKRGSLQKMEISADGGKSWKAYNEYTKMLRLTSPTIDMPGVTSQQGVGDKEGSRGQSGMLAVSNPTTESIARKLARLRGGSESSAELPLPPALTNTGEVSPARDSQAARGKIPFHLQSFLLGLLAGIAVLSVLILLGVIGG